MAQTEDIIARLKLVCSGIYLGLASARGVDSGDADVSRSLNRAFSAALRRMSSGNSESSSGSDSVGGSGRALSIPSRALLALEGEEAEEKEGRIDEDEDKAKEKSKDKTKNMAKDEAKEENDSKDKRKDNDGKATPAVPGGDEVLRGAQNGGGEVKGAENSAVQDYAMRFAFLCFLFVLLEGLVEFLVASSTLLG